MPADPAHDIVLFGGTGFTGGLTADYLAAHAPATLSWALAGRNRGKLEATRERIAAINPDHAEIELLHAEIGDAASLRSIAGSARVVITTVGPYISYGEPLAAACAAAGTDYVDLTGEPEFVDLVWLRHHETARRSGARLVHCCGFDSIPHDLGARFTVGQLPEDVPIAIEGFVRAGGAFSGGTYHSAINQFSRVRSLAKVASERRKLEGQPPGRRVRGIKPAPLRRYEGGGWALPMPTIDPQIILRSARALQRYGPDFSYGHNVVVPNLPAAAGLAAGVGGLIALAQLPPTRKLLLKLKDPGDGPSEADREKAWFKVRFVGEGGGARVVTEVSGGDPGYSETAKMLACSALCLALDELPETGGQVTTTEAMGEALTARLQSAGIRFDVLDGQR